MIGRRLQTIRFRLALALAVALFPVLALGVWQAATGFQNETRYQRQDLLRSVERHSAEARNRLDSIAVLLDVLKPDSSGAGCEARLGDIVNRMKGVYALVRYDATGKVICSSRELPYQRVASEISWFARLRAGEPMTIARGGAGVYGPEPSLIAAVRVASPGGRFNGGFVAVLPLSSLRHAEQSPTLPAGTEVAIVDRGGALLTATSTAAFAGIPRNWAQSLSARPSSNFYGRDAEGRERVYAGASLVGDDVYFLISAPAQEMFTWAMLNPVATLLLPLLAWLLALAAVLTVTERVVIRWLGYLERIASIYAKGRLSVRPVQARHAPLEIRALATTLEQMAEAIDARDHSLRESLSHKDALMREIHHRVKNNLQVISSLLNMQQRSLTDPAARAAMSDTRQRITALSLIYRALYQSPDLRRADVRQFLEELIAQLMASDLGKGPLVRTEIEVDPLIIDPDKLAPLALWAVEAITNAQKHAFEGRGGTLKVRFKVGGELSSLEVEDDGPGQSAGMDQSRGVGRTLMNAFARQLRGQSEVHEAPGGGLLARLSFPTPEAAEPLPQENGNPRSSLAFG